MKQSLLYCLIFVLIFPFLLAGTKMINIKGFYLGMNRSAVEGEYKKLKTSGIARYISIEHEKYRDMIKLDNEFSSMGNKIDIFYDKGGKVTGITFQYKTVNILFKAEKLSAEELVKNIEKEFKLPTMKFKDQGMFQNWTHIDSELNIKISIDSSKNLRLKKMKK